MTVKKILKYIHITKTSGSYIEELGKKKNNNWGRYDKCLKFNNLPKKSNGAQWHAPLRFFKKYPYDRNTILFTVVRNPYDRIISECLCKWGGKYAKQMKTIKHLNNYITQQVRKKKEIDLTFYHFFPQHFYTHNEKGEQVVNHIIKYEDISKFNDLMKQYSIDITYIVKKDKNRFTVKDISKNNIKLINEVYALDFKYYNYDKL